MQKYYIDKDGNYLGSFDGLEPASGIEVSTPPDNAKQIYNLKTNQWGQLPEDDLTVLEQLLVNKGVITKEDINAEKKARKDKGLLVR